MMSPTEPKAVDMVLVKPFHKVEDRTRTCPDSREGFDVSIIVVQTSSCRLRQL